MEVQAVGLARAMGLHAIVKPVKPSGLLRALPWLARFPGVPAVASETLEPPYPTIAITCGRRHAGASIALRRLSAGKTYTIHIQDPRVSPSLFDTLVVPDHDPPRGPNVITTTGSLNRISDDHLRREAAIFAAQVAPLPKPRIAVNLGGDTRQYKIDKARADNIVEDLRSLLNSQRCGLMVTTSRRTGKPLMDALAMLANRADTLLWTGDGPNPYMGFLGLTDAIIVTSDSINMVSEACSTGKPVHIIRMGNEPIRRAKFLEAVQQQDLARAFEGKVEFWSPTPLRETERVAERLVVQLKSAGILG
ncbi:MAG: mitochondrial fission ELM1 family protein [Alphaproteobacteria bacterium]|nr:mitochondrial fission ELM1 family protein [Alphaproteobacteria bacterium]